MSRRNFGAAAVLIASVLGGAEPTNAQGSAYEQVISPILQTRCVHCHGAEKQKAKLALHTWDALTKGSDAGPVIVAGKPAESVLLERLRLPVTEEEHMPPAEEPQPAPEEVSLIARWLEQGASRTATLHELKLTPSLLKAAAELPAKLAAVAPPATSSEPLWEIDEATVAKLRAPLAPTVTALQRHFPGALNYESRTSADLHFTAAGFGKIFDDSALAQLETVRDRLVVLDIASTSVTDASAGVLGSFTRLRVLRAGFTMLGDAAVEKLSALQQLESLSLPGTLVTGASIRVLAKLDGLRALRVAGTGAEQPARESNLPVTPSAVELLAPIEPIVETKSP